MALPQSALSELLEAFRAGDGVDLIREAVRVALQELIEAEATERIGAAPYERTDSRVTDRNGHRPRVLSTKAGDVELRIPKLRKGSFFPVILEPRRRIDQALYAVVMEAYVHGVSTRVRPGDGGGRPRSDALDSASAAFEDAERERKRVAAALKLARKRADRLMKEAKRTKKLAKAAAEDRDDAGSELAEDFAARDNRQAKLAKAQAAVAAAQAASAATEPVAAVTTSTPAKSEPPKRSPTRKQPATKTSPVKKATPARKAPAKRAAQAKSTPAKKTTAKRTSAKKA
jgi:hypothetical protein